MTTIARTVAAARFLAAVVVAGQRFLLPLVVHAAVLAVLFGGDPGRAPGPWAASALAVYPAAAWLALVVANAEDPVARTVTVVAAGGRGPVAAATLLVALAGDLVLVALSVLWPIVTGHYDYLGGALGLGVPGHLAGAAAGTAVGLLCARPVVRRIGWSFCLAAVVVVVTAVQPWLPPVGTAVLALTSGGPAPVGSAVIGLGLAGLAAAVAWWVDRRR
jgi:hypothetical protein